MVAFSLVGKKSELNWRGKFFFFILFKRKRRVCYIYKEIENCCQKNSGIFQGEGNIVNENVEMKELCLSMKIGRELGETLR